MFEILGQFGTLILAVVALVLVSSGGLMLALGLRTFRSGRMQDRIEGYVSGTDPKYSFGDSIIETRELEGSLTERIIIPAVRSIGEFLGRFTPNESINALNRQLTIANNPLGMTAREFYGVRIIVLVTSSLIPLYFISSGIDPSRLLFLLLFPLVGYIAPLAWLSARVRQRQAEILRALPDTLDMFSVCASAGLGFDQAMQRISEYFDNPLGEELGRVILEMEVGVSRHNALRNFAERFDVSDLSSFISVVLQSESLGMSIADTLHAQARQMRILRRYRAQEAAQRLPAKMLFPLAFFMLPALFAILLGPALPTLVELFQNF